MRGIIYRYLYIIYQDKNLGDKDEHKFYSMNVSLICHKNSHQLWLLGVVDNTTKEFRIEASFSRDTPKIQNFIHKFIDITTIF